MSTGPDSTGPDERAAAQHPAGAGDAWDHGEPEHVDSDEGEPDIEPFAGEKSTSEGGQTRRPHGYGYE